MPFPSPQRQPHPLDLTAVLLQLQVLETDCWSLGEGAAVRCGLPCSSCLTSPGTPAPAPSCSPAQAPLLALELSHPQDSKTGEEREDEPPLLPPTNSFSNMILTWAFLSIQRSESAHSSSLSGGKYSGFCFVLFVCFPYWSYCLTRNGEGEEERERSKRDRG